VNQHETNKQLSEEEPLQPLPELPFTSADVRTATQQATEIGKTLRSLLPPKVPKAKAAASKRKAKQDGAGGESENGAPPADTSAAGEQPAKRRRAKTPK
jgi:hypothetical protein